jgi:ABC-type uncharacterized transport system involved in gliding motility auxiliary subunit
MASSRKDSVAARQAQFGATASIYTLVIIAVLVLVNWLGNRYNKTFDATSNKKFTLSQETKKIVGNIKSDLNITYFDRPTNFEQVRTMLNQYADLSKKVHVKYVDLQKNPTLARSYFVQSAGTAFVEYEGRREAAKAVTEEGLTGALVKSMKGVRKVCFVSGSGEHPLDETTASGLSQFKTLLQHDNYQADKITLLDKTAVPADCTVVAVVGPRNDYTANEVGALKKYVEGGGRVFFLLDPPLNFGRESITENTGLTDLLGSWGVTMDKDLVLEQNPVGQLLGMGPEIPIVSSYESHPIVNDLKDTATGFPISRSMQVKNGDKTTVAKLFSTTDRAIATTKLTSNEINPNDPNNKKGPFVLGAAGSYNNGDPKKPGRFVVIGSSGFLDNGTVGFQGNRDLALNTINWLSSDEDLISIRPKETEDRRLNVNQRQMNMFAYTTLIAIPLLIIVSGVMIFLKRR